MSSWRENEAGALGVPAAMPTAPIIGAGLFGELVRAARPELERPGAGMPKVRAAQVGLFDEMGGLFEAQAEKRDAGCNKPEA